MARPGLPGSLTVHLHVQLTLAALTGAGEVRFRTIISRSVVELMSAVPFSWAVIISIHGLFPELISATATCVCSSPRPCWRAALNIGCLPLPTVLAGGGEVQPGPSSHDR